MNLYGYAGGDPINNHDPFGLDVVFKNDENGVMASSWAHAKRTLRSSAKAGDADAQTALMAMRRMENDQERTYTFENVARARGLGNAQGTTATIAVGAIGVAREYDRLVVNVASTLVHEAGHLYYENGPGAINPTSYWSQAWAMSFDNAYRRSVNMAERLNHNSYPRRP